MSKLTSIHGDILRDAFDAAACCLERHRDAINALNVFPVPDGDTGTNMLLTMRSANEFAMTVPSQSAGSTLDAIAHGALLGARGNSGVILSQFLQGMANAISGKSRIDATDLAAAFGSAYESAWRSVGRPVHGTMLTVMQKIAEVAKAEIEADNRDILTMWRALVDGGKIALSMTPLQLPVLKEAGVVDAGGQGVLVILEGACCFLFGQNVDDMEITLCAPCDFDGMDIDHIESQAEVNTTNQLDSDGGQYGYCTQFLIDGDGLDIDAIRDEFTDIADSTVVVGGVTLAKVHVHSSNPDRILSYASGLGHLSQISIDNMDEQHADFAAAQTIPGGLSDKYSGLQAARKVRVVSVVSGRGFELLFGELGCDAMVLGGQTMNPSAREILDAAVSMGDVDVILLPNNSNIILTAQQAAKLAGDSKWEHEAANIHVVPSQTIVQGIAAMLGFNLEMDVYWNVDSMSRGLNSVKTVEVTTSTKDAHIDGRLVEKGQYISLIDGIVTDTGDSARSVLSQTISNLDHSRVEIITLYWGYEIDEVEATKMAEQLRNDSPSLMIDAVYGGQPYYDYIVSVE